MKHLEETPWWICDEGDENYYIPKLPGERTF